MDETGMEAYVKYNRFHLEQRPRYKPNPFHHDNFHYNTAEDYYVCLMGQHMTRTGTSLKDSKRLPQRERPLSRTERPGLSVAISLL